MRRRKTKNLIYRYTFRQNVDMHEIETSLLLAVFGLESLYGESRVRLEAAHALDTEGHTCVIDASNDVGRDFNRLFIGYLRREFGEDSFRVEDVAQSATQA